jgi:hypothetical protein
LVFSLSFLFVCPSTLALSLKKQALDALLREKVAETLRLSVRSASVVSVPSLSSPQTTDDLQLDILVLNDHASGFFCPVRAPTPDCRDR